MFDDLKNAPDIYKPSKFWQKLNKTHVSQISETGFNNFKRSVNMRYFNWGILGIIRLQLFPIIYGVTNFNFKPILKSHLVKSSSQKGIRNFNGPNAFIYKTYVAYLYDFVKTFDRLNILATIKEPSLGNPFLIKYAGKEISQDLCNSVFEFYSIFNHLKIQKKINIAELGAGYGRTAYVFLKTLPTCTYTIIDIPPALYLSQEYISRVFPKEKVFSYRSFSSYSKIKKEFESSRIRFLMPHQIELIPKKSFDLFINISSLHEMYISQIKNYFIQMNRLVSGYVYTKQWLKSLTSDNHHIKMKDYPTPKNWKVLYQHQHKIQNMFFEALYQLPKK